ncbi:tRNA (adenosine(37)-N6)-dimethylallyltransferase MiaA [Sungkyunkwania multivorans]|uniref:tRNA dimethylallyltransferase n=1 Tax=Sungkyunkwania multivorans TaxID=1173618 RepID=A0ABW3D0C3_9FLAO
MNTRASNKTLISVVGPTAIGKTALGIALAKNYGTDIVSCDSRQFFKEMSIGTAVPTKEELAAVKHHFIQHISVDNAYSVGDFERDAITKLNELFEVNHIVVMVGGSGLYVDAVTKGLDDFPDVNPEIRAQLKKDHEHEGIGSLQKRLQVLDPEYFNSVDINNPHRLIRALEICIGTKRSYSSFLRKKKTDRNFDVITIGLTAERSIIYDRIHRRVDLMMEAGLMEEAKALYPKRELNALQTVGYKELFTYFDEEWTLDLAVSEIKKNTRRFAKRQLTWFKRNEDTIWFEYQTPVSEIISTLNDVIKT